MTGQPFDMDPIQRDVLRHESGHLKQALGE